MNGERNQLCKRYAFIGVAVAGNGGKPVITVYGVRGMDGLLADVTPDDIRKMGNALLISLRPSAEKLFVETGIDTISIHTLVYVAGGCCFSTDDINAAALILQSCSSHKDSGKR